MSIASPTLRSSSSTAPGPSLSNSPTSIRARPSTAETCTGTSNTASRSAALREASSLSAVTGPLWRGTTSGLLSSSGSGTLGSSLMPQASKTFSTGAAAAGRDVTLDRFADRGFGLAAVARNAAVRPFDAAVAERHAGLDQNDQTAV